MISGGGEITRSIPGKDAVMIGGVRDKIIKRDKVVSDDSRTEVRRDELIVSRGLAKLDFGVGRHGSGPGEDHIGAGQGLLRDRRDDWAATLGWRNDDSDILAGGEVAVTRGQ